MICVEASRPFPVRKPSAPRRSANGPAAGKAGFGMFGTIRADLDGFPSTHFAVCWDGHGGI